MHHITYRAAGPPVNCAERTKSIQHVTPRQASAFQQLGTTVCKSHYKDSYDSAWPHNQDGFQGVEQDESVFSGMHELPFEREVASPQTARRSLPFKEQEEQASLFNLPFESDQIQENNVVATFSISVCNMNGRTIKLEVQKKLTIGELKTKIAEAQGSFTGGTEHMTLVSFGKQLTDTMTLEQYNIQPDTTVQQVLRLRGG